MIFYRDMRNERGAVLLLTLMILSILAVVVIQSMRTMQVNTVGAMFFRNGAQADALALSGVRLAEALLYQDSVLDKEADGIVDTLQEDWAMFPECRDFVPPSFITGDVSLRIVDEQGKFPVNTLAQRGGGSGDADKSFTLVVATVLEAAALGDDDAQDVAKHVTWALKDWMDTDKESSVDIASQDAGYTNVEEEDDCRNAPLTCLDEIRLVLLRLGLDAALVHVLYFGKPEIFPGLRDLLTVMHTGGVNINTAHPFVLTALARDVEEDVALPLALAMDTYRRDPWNRDQLIKSDWYRNLAVEGSAFVTFPGTVTRSSCFSVLATGTVGAISRTALAFVRRGDTVDTTKGIPGNVKVERIEW